MALLKRNILSAELANSVNNDPFTALVNDAGPPPLAYTDVPPFTDEYEEPSSRKRFRLTSATRTKSCTWIRSLTGELSMFTVLKPAACTTASAWAATLGSLTVPERTTEPFAWLRRMSSFGNRARICESISDRFVRTYTSKTTKRP